MTKIADQTVILIRKADARVLAVLVVHQEVVHLRQVVHQGVQAPALVHHAPIFGRTSIISWTRQGKFPFLLH